MWKGHQINNDKLDRFGEELLHAIEASDAEVNAAGSSPFLYRRIQARIEAEQKRMAQERSRWFALLIEAKHAIPVLTMICLIAVGLLWYGPSLTPQSGISPGSTQASYISPLSNDEMMASIVGWSERNSNQRKEQ